MAGIADVWGIADVLLHLTQINIQTVGSLLSCRCLREERFFSRFAPKKELLGKPTLGFEQPKAKKTITTTSFDKMLFEKQELENACKFCSQLCRSTNKEALARWSCFEEQSV